MKYQPHIFVTVDIVVTRRYEGEIQILLIQRKNEPFQNYWALPGGFVDKNEHIEAAAKRELLEETNIQLFQVKQIGAFGDPNRDPRHHTLSVAYYGEVDALAEAKAQDDAKSVQWFSLNELPALAFDHNDIIREAIEKYIIKPSY
ncbi:MAG TPA: NUDIX hydrolase [Flavobacterium sp.]|nr:NUDIX hydrolase [Flavobacterium sp.]